MKISSTIILERSLQATSFTAGTLIHQAAFERACALIKKQIELAKSYNPEAKTITAAYPPKVDRYHNTISIFGGRGTGKTSFLYSLLDEFAQPHKRVAVLKVIDPTLVEEKGHFFLLILSLINELVSEKLGKDECSINSENYCMRKMWNQKLKKLAQGIPSLDKIGDNYQNSSWQDAEYIMGKGLTCFQSAFHLEEHFHNLVAFALKLLDKDLFLIAFDDIDVNFSKGWEVLEVIRKYMTTPHIVTLLSGNMNLYIKNIRKQQWNNLGKGLLINEAAEECGKQEYKQTVNELEGQYMLKILKPENRIYLHTLHTCINHYGQEILVVNSNARAEKIEVIYDRILNSYGIINKDQLYIYRSVLLNLSIRSQVHFLMAHINGRPNDASAISAFISRMYANNIDVDLALYSPNALNRIIMNFLLNERCVLEAYQLIPVRDNLEQNICLIGLNFLFVQNSTNDPFLTFDYLIRVGFMRNLLNIMNYSDNTAESRKEHNFDALCRYSEVFQNSLSRDIIGHSIAYIATDVSNKKVAPGYSFLLSHHERINNILRGNDIHSIIASIPLCRIASDDRSCYVYSFYLILGSITDFIRIMQAEGDLYAAFKRHMLIRMYECPTSEVSMPKGSIFEQTRILRSETCCPIEEDPESIYFVNVFTAWYSKFKEVTQTTDKTRHKSTKGRAIQPHLLGKISTRIYHAINDIESTYILDKELGGAYYAQVLNRCVIAFFNAVLIEEFVENYQKFKTNNPEEEYFRNDIIMLNSVENSSIFSKNLSFLLQTFGKKGILEIIPFTHWMLQCPLLLKYVDYASEIWEMDDCVQKYLNTNLNWKKLCQGNLVSLMKE